MTLSPGTLHTAADQTRPRLDVAEGGDPAGPAVVLLHGLSDSRRSYEPLVRHLPPWIHTLAVSHRGHGDSDRPSTGYTPKDMARDVANLLDDHGLASAVIVGHSMSSVVAQRFAIDHPDRTDALVLIAAFAPLQDDPIVGEAEALFGDLSDPVPESFVREFQASTIAVPIPPAFFEQVVAESLKVPARVWKAAWAGLRTADLTPDFHRITAPTLLAWGDQDMYCSRDMQERLLAAISDSRLRIYPGLGHSPHWEQPARFAVDLAAFVSDTLLVGRSS